MDNIDDWGVAVVGDGVTVSSNTVVAPKEMIDKDI